MSSTLEDFRLAPTPQETSLLLGKFPRFRYMGSKFKLAPWLQDTFEKLSFETVTDAFSGSGVVSYLLKRMGKQVRSNDSLAFPAVLTCATIANNATHLEADDLAMLLSSRARSTEDQFIHRTFKGIFYTPAELQFLDDLWAGVRCLDSPFKRSIALAAILRSAIKRQPRGLFTVSDPERYQDGRRDLMLTLKEHFVEQVSEYNNSVFSNGKKNTSTSSDVFSVAPGSDLVYMDPPYVPRSDDNCYMKRYHFLEGLACYWKDKTIMMSSKVRKIVKPFTPFSSRTTALDSFDRLFHHFAESTLVLSYSSNAYPDLSTLRTLMLRYKKSVDVLEKNHRYHFGTHETAKRNNVKEYLVVGTA